MVFLLGIYVNACMNIVTSVFITSIKKNVGCLNNVTQGVINYNTTLL